jgi:hypothetical protein
MSANNPKSQEATGGGLVTVTDWNACYNSGDDVIALSCTVAANDSSATISGVGLILNNSKEMIIGSFYTEFSGGVESATPALNLSPSGIAVGDTVWGVVSGEVQGKHYFIEQKLTVSSC